MWRHKKRTFGKTARAFNEAGMRSYALPGFSWNKTSCCDPEDVREGKNKSPPNIHVLSDRTKLHDTILFPEKRTYHQHVYIGIL